MTHISKTPRPPSSCFSFNSFSVAASLGPWIASPTCPGRVPLGRRRAPPSPHFSPSKGERTAGPARKTSKERAPAVESCTGSTATKMACVRDCLAKPAGTVKPTASRLHVCVGLYLLPQCSAAVVLRNPFGRAAVHRLRVSVMAGCLSLSLSLL